MKTCGIRKLLLLLMSATVTLVLKGSVKYKLWTDSASGAVLRLATNDDNATVHVFGYESREPGGVLNIPSTIIYDRKSYTVTGIDDLARCCKKITSVIIPNTITNITSLCFSGCTNLTSITIPESVVKIGYGAFRKCTKLTSVTIPHGVEIINYRMFDGCTSLTNVTIPNSVTNICFEAFQDCSSIEHITIPNGVTTIGSSAFIKCINLTSVTIPNSATNTTGYKTFAGCSSLTDVAIGSGVPNIGYGMFSECTKLRDIVIPNGVTNVDSCAFSGCTNLARMTIGSGVRNISYDAFPETNRLESITVDERNKTYASSLLGFLLTKDEKNLIKGVNSDVAIVPLEITNIHYRAFRGCPNLQRVIMPSAVTTLGSSAFENCVELRSVVFPYGVELIDSGAFRDCSELTDIRIPAAVTLIGGSAFSGCRGLTNLLFEGNAPSVGWNAFDSVNTACVAYVHQLSTGWDVSIPGRWNNISIAYSDYSPLPALSDDANHETVKAALSGVADAGLAAGITNASMYNAYCGWVQSITNAILTAQSVRDSYTAWHSFALGADALIKNDITSDDVHIISFRTDATTPVGTTLPNCSFEVAIDGVDIGASDAVSLETLKANIKKVLGVEGAATLSPDAFSQDNLEIVVDTPVNGRARFTVKPPNDAHKAFFMRVKVNK